MLKDLGVEARADQDADASTRSTRCTSILNAEAAAAFDDLTREGHHATGSNTWPSDVPPGQFIPAVEYLRAKRVRTLLMQEMAKLMTKVDLYVGGNDLMITNLTGHPTVVLPNGFAQGAKRRRDADVDHVHRPAVRRDGAAGGGQSVPAGDRAPPEAAAAQRLAARRSLRSRARSPPKTPGRG